MASELLFVSWEKELMCYCGNRQALQQNQEIPHWWKTFSITTKHPSFQAKRICTAPTRCGVHITRLLDVEEEGTLRQNQRTCLLPAAVLVVELS